MLQKKTFGRNFFRISILEIWQNWKIAKTVHEVQKFARIEMFFF